MAWAWLWAVLAACGGGSGSQGPEGSPAPGDDDAVCNYDYLVVFVVDSRGERFAADLVTWSFEGSDPTELSGNGRYQADHGKMGTHELVVTACGGAQVITETMEGDGKACTLTDTATYDRHEIAVEDC